MLKLLSIRLGTIYLSIFIVYRAAARSSFYYISIFFISSRFFYNQSTNSGDGFVLDGGIGYTHIIIAIDARATTFFDQNTKIFGY